tara:strand:+ start:7319 stop:7666 length:348 start_codon:yes stop_codon:yes gene_type:complete
LISYWDEYIGILSENGKDAFKNIEYRSIGLDCLERTNIRQELSIFDRSERSLSVNFYSAADNVPIMETRHLRGRNSEVFSSKLAGTRKSNHEYKYEKEVTIYGGWIFQGKITNIY